MLLPLLWATLSLLNTIPHTCLAVLWILPGRSGVLNIPSISTTPRIIARTKDCTPWGPCCSHGGVQQPCTGPCAGEAASACMLLHAIVSLTVKEQQELHICPSCVSRGLCLCPNKWQWTGEGVIAPDGMNQGLASS